MRDDSVTTTCPVCGTAVVASGRRRYCSGAYRQAAWRQRHHPVAPATQPSPAPRSASVYQCPACDARYLGCQRCEECNQFCRRLGPGAPCPHCDEPVAVADLTPATSIKETTQIT